MRRGVLEFAVLMLALLPPVAATVIVDRIVATVGQRMITLSDVQEAYRFECLLNQKPLQPLDAARIREVAGRLVDQALLEQEMESTQFPRVPPAEVDRRMAEIKKGFANNGEFHRALEQYGLDEQRVRRRAELQTNVLRFLDFRFRPGVQVDEPAIERYYRETLLPELREKGTQKIPGLEEVRDRIEEVLVQERINQQLDAWIKDLRRQATIRFR